ncbi:DMP19 family protein [Kineococcus rhizosphaerae]|uniref:DNA mimic protein DMP19 C-terminal domain-containing protein n=1 Tax=Kineococcus rhizosphaerae TaxID=559628 RepID=A0A2T0QZS8_9ACTN|nr:hypothetical protein [Kineococcus rhizosphaerae]PRY12194.1 hypothetical protein CLV37_111151 [Kineococcus rhizosphaerae]
MTPLLDAVNVPAVLAHQRQDASAPPGLRRLGAALALHGIAENGGLVGGAVENLFFGDRLREVDDAADGYRWLGLTDVADLVLRAREEYLRFRPTGWEELSGEDEQLWSELDSEFSAVATDDRLEAAVAGRLAEIAPGLG